MQLDRLVRWASVAVLVGLVALVPATLLLAHSPRLKEWIGLSNAFNVPYAVGEPIDLPPEFFNETDLTVILLSRATCPGCVAAKPLFAELASAVTRARSGVTMEVVTYGPHTVEEEAFVDDIGLPPSSLRRFAAPLRARVTPTLFVVDRSGHILGVREGSPTQADIKTLIALLVPDDQGEHRP